MADLPAYLAGLEAQLERAVGRMRLAQQEFERARADANAAAGAVQAVRRLVEDAGRPSGAAEEGAVPCVQAGGDSDSAAAGRG